jgi:uncharacterized protein
MGKTVKSDVNWSMIAHLGGLGAYVLPFGNIWIPLLVWLAKRKEGANIDQAGKEAVNFNISFSIYGLIAGLMCFVFIGFLLLPVILITHLILVARAGLAANKGESFQYPLTLRFVK